MKSESLRPLQRFAAATFAAENRPPQRGPERSNIRQAITVGISSGKAVSAAILYALCLSSANAHPHDRPGATLLHVKVDDDGRVIRCRYVGSKPESERLSDKQGKEACRRFKGAKFAQSIDQSPDSDREFVFELPNSPIIN